jgi:hypothetical protein
LLPGTGPDEERSRCQYYEREQKGVLNEVLALFITQNVHYRSHCRSSDAQHWWNWETIHLTGPQVGG